VRPALSRRIGEAFSVGFPDADERQRVIDAATAPRVATFDDLPPDVQQLVVDLERRAG
jgi:hypothetical protein